MPVYLRIDRPEFRAVAHDDGICPKRHEGAGALGVIWDHHSEFRVANLAPDHRNELLRRIDVTAASVEEEIDIAARLNVVEKIHEPDSVLTMDGRVPTRDIADQTTSGQALDFADQALSLVSRGMDGLEEWRLRRAYGRRSGFRFEEGLGTGRFIYHDYPFSDWAQRAQMVLPWVTK